MRNDYFSDLVAPGVPGTPPKTGDASKAELMRLSPPFPVSPAEKTMTGTEPLHDFCTGLACLYHETIDLPRQGPTPGCIKNEGGQTWRRLDRMTGCPLDN
jgi:hypothetical protein